MQMISTEVLIELDEAAGELKAAQDKVRGICRRIADGGEESAKPAGSKPKGSPGSEPKKSGSRGRGFRPPVEGDPAALAKKEYWRKVQCSECHESKGSRVYDGVRYPVLHKGVGSDKPCPGCFRPGVEIHQ